MSGRTHLKHCMPSAGTTRFELAAFAVTGRRSNQLIYVPADSTSYTCGRYTFKFEPSLDRQGINYNCAKMSI